MAMSSHKQVTYSDASITISLSLCFRLLIPQVKRQPHGFFFSIQLAASSTFSRKSSMLQQSVSLFKHVLQKRYEVRTDGEVAVFVRESASLVTGKTDKMDTDHEASSAWTDLAR